MRAPIALWKVMTPSGTRWGVGPVGVGPEALMRPSCTIDQLLAQGGSDVLVGLEDSVELEDLDPSTQLVAPVDSQEVWAAGVTYQRSRDARVDEATAADHYLRVYEAPRPELFFKASGHRVRGPHETVGIRTDSTWDVPEGELGLVLSATGDVVGYVVGNDISSRSIEGENPLYLPQAKCFTGSCALGPCIVPLAEAPPLGDMSIRVTIRRGLGTLFEDRCQVSDMRRTPEELAEWLFAAMDFPNGAVLLTGTSLIPPLEFTLQAGDEVTVSVDGLGELVNVVERVGRGVNDNARRAVGAP